MPVGESTGSPTLFHWMDKISGGSVLLGVADMTCKESQLKSLASVGICCTDLVQK